MLTSIAITGLSVASSMPVHCFIHILVIVFRYCAMVLDIYIFVSNFLLVCSKERGIESKIDFSDLVDVPKYMK